MASSSSASSWLSSGPLSGSLGICFSFVGFMVSSVFICCLVGPDFKLVVDNGVQGLGGAAGDGIELLGFQLGFFGPCFRLIGNLLFVCRIHGFLRFIWLFVWSRLSNCISTAG